MHISWALRGNEEQPDHNSLRNGTENLELNLVLPSLGDRSL